MAIASVIRRRTPGTHGDAARVAAREQLASRVSHATVAVGHGWTSAHARDVHQPYTQSITGAGRQFALTGAVPILSILFKHLELAMRLHAAVPSLELPDAYAHVLAAEAAASNQVAPELLLGVAFIESRFDPTAVSRVQGMVRKTGRYPSIEAPARLNPRASLYCGPLQTYASSWSTCLRLRDLRVAYAAGAHELDRWLGDRRVRGNVTRALAGHGCGNRGVITGACNDYPRRVLWMQRQFGDDRRRPPRATVASM